MEQYEYRFGAKVVAVVEVIFAVINVLILAMCFGAAVYVTTLDDTTKVEFEQYLEEYGVGLDAKAVGLFLWIFTVSFGIGVLFTTIAAFKLLKATQIGAHPADALSQAKFWRVVTVVFLCLAAFYYASSLLLIRLAVLLLIRGIFLYAVSKYITELERTTATLAAGVQYQASNQNQYEENKFPPPPAYGYVKV